MAFVPTTNAWEVKLGWQDAFKSYSNIIHVLSGGGALDAGAAGLVATAVSGSYSGTDLQTSLQEDVVLSTVTVTDIRTEGAPQFVIDTNTPSAGGANLLPNGVALCLTLRSSFRDRSGRGRMYIGGWTEEMNDGDGRASTAAVAALSDFGDALLANLAGATFPLGVVSKVHNTLVLNPRVIREVRTTQVRDNQWDTQRRRQHITS